MSDQPQGPNPPQQPKRISIDIPKELQAVYANVAFISHTPAEMVLDFAQVLPRMPHGSVQARVIMSPMHAKMLQLALAQNVANYERQFGEIRLPQQMNLADQFFRFPQQEQDDNDKE
jgi:proline-rich tail region repeat protein